MLSLIRLTTCLTRWRVGFSYSTTTLSQSSVSSTRIRSSQKEWVLDFNLIDIKVIEMSFSVRTKQMKRFGDECEDGKGNADHNNTDNDNHNQNHNYYSHNDDNHSFHYHWRYNRDSNHNRESDPSTWNRLEAYLMVTSCVSHCIRCFGRFHRLLDGNWNRYSF